MILAVGGMAAYGYYDIVYPLALALFSMIWMPLQNVLK